MTKPITVWAKLGLRSAWASAQSDLSLCCALYGKVMAHVSFMCPVKTLIRWHDQTNKDSDQPGHLVLAVQSISRLCAKESSCVL